MELSSLGRFPSLDSKVVFITGGGTGIGAALTECFVAQGSRVAFVDIDVDGSNRLQDALQAQYGRKPLFRRCDITDIAALQKTIAEIAAELGPIDVLVNNAANDQRHKWQDTTVEYWDERMAINLRPMFFAMQAVLPGMTAKKAGSIINIGSMSWKARQGGMPAYTTAKAAIHGLTRGMARDVGKDNIRVNTVVPGWVMTERQLKLWVTPESGAEIDRQQCLAGRVMPVDIAQMVLFLAADDSKMCSAQEFTVDGGWV
ncbi:NAD(P)-dependent dehydrogenase (short-subunit alcohol dehydrogenase family) [Dongia mobilis]|uniref:NAD(P)-dependent dehydrogenase (Short-subunit alcohol dehydrogenase family) n=1 Tax=Dongia mobilis TaxID=578943 RepID=A0A4R6WWL9_9PROT|nr:SDR family oxidoreductase [Dongia mobilis]TDQ86503.1 NAD(P)-dependent dehydrogenase (short-subunit alcohol dehydrogenase family) [Dongia mobilis]